MAVSSIILNAARKIWSIAQRGATALRAKLGRADHRPPAWEADVVDDIAFNRPWNIAVKLLRVQARIRKRSLRPGATIVVVNWNTLAVTQDTLHAVRALTPSDVTIMVVDNGSIDGSKSWLRSQEGLRKVFLPANAGHAIALDIAVLLARTKVVVTLDSDAVPLRVGWLDTVLDPMAQDGIILAGLRSSRDFVHPVFSAVDVRSFIDRNLSFQVYRDPGVTDEALVWGTNSWDTGELMTARVGNQEVVLVDPTDNPVGLLPGMTTGGVVYHHGGVTRSTEDAATDSEQESYQSWRAALEQILPAAALRPAVED